MMLHRQTAAFIAVLAVASLGFTAVQGMAQGIQTQPAQGTSSVSGGLVDLEARVAALESMNEALLARITTLEADVATLKANTVLQLDGLLSLDETSRTDCQPGAVAGDCPVAIFDGVNVQIVNGTGQTIPDQTAGPDGPNGLGNLIIGYDEYPDNINPLSRCSDGAYIGSGDCTAAGAVWSLAHRTGTHNLIVGPGNNYSQAAGVVFGMRNTINRNLATITGGSNNLASGVLAHVGGGGRDFAGNTASGKSASVTGGLGNTASGENASISGGNHNTASGHISSVNGGDLNQATGLVASVNGGTRNTAGGRFASVNGGRNNEASGDTATIGGGDGCTMNHDEGWGAGPPDLAGGC